MTSFHEIDLKMVMTVKNEKDKFKFYSGIIVYNTSVVNQIYYPKNIKLTHNAEPIIEIFIFI